MSKKHWLFLPLLLLAFTNSAWSRPQLFRGHYIIASSEPDHSFNIETEADWEKFRAQLPKNKVAKRGPATPNPDPLRDPKLSQGSRAVVIVIPGTLHAYPIITSITKSPQEWTVRYRLQTNDRNLATLEGMGVYAAAMLPKDSRLVTTEPDPNELVSDQFLMALQNLDATALRSLCHPRFWDVEADSAEELLEQTKRKGFRLAAGSLRLGPDTRQVATYDIYRTLNGQEKLVDRIYVYFVDGLARWVDEDERHVRRFLDGE